MRGKRSKQYRKLMQQYGLHFGFREPYQVLLDAEILLEAARCRMNFIKMLEGALHGTVKPMITQCSMRHLYAARPKNEMVVAKAKDFEKRRCGHHTLDQPLSTLECLSSVVDPKGSRTNKHRYVVASQDRDLHEYMQNIPGVPLVYLLRSVMIMKPMSDATAQTRAREEASKFSMGLKGDRKASLAVDRQNTQSEGESDQSRGTAQQTVDEEVRVKKKRVRTMKGANPLSSKAPSKVKQQERARSGQESRGSTRRKRRATAGTTMYGSVMNAGTEPRLG